LKASAKTADEGAIFTSGSCGPTSQKGGVNCAGRGGTGKEDLLFGSLIREEKVDSSQGNSGGRVQRARREFYGNSRFIKKGGAISSAGALTFGASAGPKEGLKNCGL